jgi:hypothetical protein
VCKFCARRFYFSFTFVLTNNESGAQLSELRDLAHQNIGQLNRAMAGWFEFARKTLDAAEANVAALCDHASQLARADEIREVVDGFDAEAVDGRDACRQGSGGVIEAL